MFYVVAAHKSLEHFGLHFLLSSQEPCIISTLIFLLCICNLFLSARPFSPAFMPIRKQSKPSLSPSCTSIRCPLSLRATVKFSGVVRSFSRYLLTSRSRLSVLPFCLQPPLSNSCCAHGDLRATQQNEQFSILIWTSREWTCLWPSPPTSL